MSPELMVIRHLMRTLAARWRASRADSEGGYTTETVVVTALLVALALTAVGIIAAKVISSANNVSTGSGP